MMEPVERGVLEQVRLRQQDPGYTDGTDIAAMLGQARYEDGAPMSEQDLRDELVTLLTDGPTSSLISWAFERILRHPQQYARLRAEIDPLAAEHSAGHDQAPDGEERPYLDAVVKETMRLCPAAPIVVRKLLEPMRARRVHDPGGDDRGAVRAPGAPPARHLPRARCASGPSASWSGVGGTSIPTRGSPSAAASRRCLAAPYAQLLMKQVIATVIAEVELRAVEPALGAPAQERDRVRAAPPRGGRRETARDLAGDGVAAVASGRGPIGLSARRLRAAGPRVALPASIPFLRAVP